jgi:hypothetical protein
MLSAKPAKGSLTRNIFLARMFLSSRFFSAVPLVFSFSNAMKTLIVSSFDFTTPIPVLKTGIKFVFG